MNTNNKAKRILCYGDSNTWGWVPMAMGMERFSVTERWPGILQDLLGKNYEVIEEGLGARMTMFDDPRPELPERNGLKTLPIILETHLPLDLVILMLGTPDTKEMMNLSSEEIAQGICELIKTIKNYKILKGANKPQVLVVVPPLVKEEADFAAKLFKGGFVKARGLVEAYKKVAESEGVFYLDPTEEIKVDENDGVHINVENHQKLAKLIYKKIVKIL